VTSAPPSVGRKCPYFGLDYYAEKYDEWFFGREPERDKVMINLRAARLTLVHADSGVGKSSLLRAGVAWELDESARRRWASGSRPRYLPVVFSQWKDDPTSALIASIGDAIAPYLGDRRAPVLPRDELEAAIAVAADTVGATLLVMLDQFEEYFVYRAHEPEPGHLAGQLAACINRADLPANFVIAVREEAYAGLGDLFQGRIHNVYGNYLDIQYLDRASAEEAIRKPVYDVYNLQPGVQKVTIEDALVSDVLDQLPARPQAHAPDGQAAVANGDSDGYVATPLLQLVMRAIWRHDVEQAGVHTLRRETLDRLEGVEHIVDTHLKGALAGLDESERTTAIDVFDHLVTPSGGKIAEPISLLAQRTGHDEDEVRKVLEALDDKRIVRSVPAPPGEDPQRFRRYEIVHDVLAPAINRVIGEQELARRTRAEREQKEAAERREQEQRRAAEQQRRAAEAERRAAEAARRSEHRFRIIAGAAVVLPLMALVAAVIAVVAYRDAAA
jgi:Novel STAND NTPase 1